MSSMPSKIKIVSYSTSGGAGGAGMSLLQGFLDLGLDASFESLSDSNLRTKPLEHPRITAAAAFDNYVARAPGWDSLVSLTRDKITVPIQIEKDVELVVLRWMNGVALEIEPGANPKVIWVLDDMNPFTGACHYALDCKQFESGCTNCPAVRQPFRKKVAVNLERKHTRLEQLKRVGFVAPTKWMHEQFLRSRLASRYPSTVIYNPLNSAFLTDRQGSLQADSQHTGPLRVLIVAADLTDPIKGVWDVAPELRELMAAGLIELTLVGGYSSQLQAALPGSAFIGRLAPELVARQMRAADILLVPSLAETAGAIVAEAASQGTPALVRSVGGLPEMVGFGERGWIFSDGRRFQSSFDSLNREQLVSKGILAMKWAGAMRPQEVSQEMLTFSQIL
jgi:glycosyltransferase involved in cell wall biosynthesis